MTAALDRATAALGNANVRAMLHIIREGESNHDETAYTIVNSGTHFAAPPWVHPYHGIPTTQGARASGAYQFLGTTWARCADALGLGTDFSPVSQDLGAVYLIEGRGAMPAVMAGDLVLACSKLAQEWVSLPGLGLARVQRVFTEYGGSFGNGGESAPDPRSHETVAPATPQQPESPMGILATLLPMVLNVLSPNASASITRVTSNPAMADVLMPFLQDLFSKIGQSTGVVPAGQPVTTDAQAVAAVAELQKLKTTNAALVQEIETHALDYLDKLAPAISEMHKREIEWAQVALEGRNAAMVRQQADTSGSVPVLVRNASTQSWAILVGLFFMVLTAMIGKYLEPNMPDYVTMLVGMFGMAIANAQKALEAIMAYFFDGTPTSNANAATQAVVDKTLAKVK